MGTPHSLWWSTLDHPLQARPPLRRHLDVDVAIVGGGFTGLWTARELLRRDPTLHIVVLEKEVCGHGASGRNGGWASALFPINAQTLVELLGVSAFNEHRRTLQNAVANLGACIREDGIDAQFAHGGSLIFARSQVQVARLKSAVETSRGFGVSSDDYEWLERDALRGHGVVGDALGATFTPHCGRLNPARLVRGLGDQAERLGVEIFENTTVVKIIPRHRGHEPEAVTIGGSVHATYIVRATEAFTATLPGERRTVAPIYSFMVATEPQSASFWEQVGFDGAETFADDRHLIIYGQRTHDGRIAFGGRGTPYHFGSTVEERFDTNTNVFTKLEKTLRELFPSLEGSITHRWGGPLAMPRDQWPSATVDASSGLAVAGGYTGDGVTLSHVAATALADLITQPDVETEFTRLPFVHRQSRRWEFEPLRWLGINTGLALANLADRGESHHNQETRAGRLLDHLLK